MNKKKLCIVSTTTGSIRVFMNEHIKALSIIYEVHVIANGDFEEINDLLDHGIVLKFVEIERQVSIINDIKALCKLFIYFKSKRFDSVISLMPKSGLLSMLASYFGGVPIRVHFFTGQVWYTKRGLFRYGLKILDKLLSMSSSHLLADSPSQRDFLVSENVVPQDKITVLGKGSISGVDVIRFRPNDGSREKIRIKHGIPFNAIVFLYMARLTYVKGIIDLASAFVSIENQIPNAHLIVVGTDEGGIDPRLSQIMRKIQNRFHRIDYTYYPEDYMCASDVFCIPSYREGFSLATIQAAGVGLPAIASRIYGLTDAVKENVTGIFHEPGSVSQISRSILKYYNDSDLRNLHSKTAMERAHDEFSQSYVVSEMVNFMRSIS